MENDYSKQKRLAFINFLIEVPNLLAIIISVIMTKSLIMFLDAISSSVNVLKEFFVFLISKKLENNLEYEYNFGISKIESLASLFCDGFLLLGIMAACVGGVYEIINPVSTSENLIYAVILKVMNVTVGFLIVLKQRNIYLGNPTAVSETEYSGAKMNLAFDAGVLVTVLVSFVLMGWPLSVYISPVVTIAIGILFAITSFGRMRKAVDDLTEKTLDENKQFTIMRCLNAHDGSYERFIAVNSKNLGNGLYIEFVLTFSDDATYEEICKLQKQLESDISKALKKEDNGVKVNIVVNGEGDSW